MFLGLLSLETGKLIGKLMTVRLLTGMSVLKAAEPCPMSRRFWSSDAPASAAWGAGVGGPVWSQGVDLIQLGPGPSLEAQKAAESPPAPLLYHMWL